MLRIYYCCNDLNGSLRPCVLGGTRRRRRRLHLWGACDPGSASGRTARLYTIVQKRVRPGAAGLQLNYAEGGLTGLRRSCLLMLCQRPRAGGGSLGTEPAATSTESMWALCQYSYWLCKVCPDSYARQGGKQRLQERTSTCGSTRRIEMQGGWQPAQQRAQGQANQGVGIENRRLTRC